MKIVWIIVIILVFAVIGYFIGKSVGNTEEDKEKNAKKGLIFGAIAGAIVSTICNTVNYTLKHKGKTVYHGIAYDTRLDCRMKEHRRSGKEFDEYISGLSIPRKLARIIEKSAIKANSPIYNIQHNC